MADIFLELANGLTSVYNEFLAGLPLWAQNFMNLLFLVILVVIFSIFIWKFHKVVSKKNVLELNLNPYKAGKVGASPTMKVLGMLLNFVEYIVILPILLFFWFAIFTIFLIFLTKGIDIATLLIISAAVMAAIRMTAYYNEDLSKEVTKLLPFNLLAVSILSPGFFSAVNIIKNLSEIPSLFSQIVIYLLFMIFLEIILRFFDFIFSLFGSSNSEKD